MRLKNDAINPIGLQPELILGIIIANEVYSIHGFEMVITSINDSKHSATSLHYSGSAIDLRTTTLDPSYDWNSVVTDIRIRLNKHYDVILEKDHIHLEWQPKRD